MGGCERQHYYSLQYCAKWVEIDSEREKGLRYLDQFDQFMTSLDKFEHVWTSLNTLGQVWTSLKMFRPI
jgi:hypothetical protein